MNVNRIQCLSCDKYYIAGEDHDCLKYTQAQHDRAINKAVKKAWISVEDRLPELFELVIVCQIDAVFTARFQGNDEWESGNWLLIQTPEYWMPLPPPPKTED